MESELNELLSKQEQMAAMQASVEDFNKKLNKDIEAFLAKHFGMAGPMTLLQIVKKVREKCSPIITG